MQTVAISAHYDGQQILLDEAYPLQPNTRLIVTILPEPVEDDERAEWARLGLQNLERAYGDDEPEYTLDNIKEWNPEYEGK
jgi:hypothetical protein